MSQGGMRCSNRAAVATRRLIHGGMPLSTKNSRAEKPERKGNNENKKKAKKNVRAKEKKKLLDEPEDVVDVDSREGVYLRNLVRRAVVDVDVAVPVFRQSVSIKLMGVSTANESNERKNEQGAGTSQTRKNEGQSRVDTRVS